MKKFLSTFLAAGAIFTAQSALADGPRYVFYFIGDGMGMAHVMTTECYNRTVRHNSEPILMMQFPVASMSTTFSASSPVTDSAAAGTALASGNKTTNGMLGMTSDTIAVKSIAYDLKQDGWGIGIVTSVCIDDATPGAFYASQPNRGMYYEIGLQAASSDYEFMAGEGLRGAVDKSGNPTDLLQVLEQNNVKVVRGLDGLKEIDTRKVMLLSDHETAVNNIGYTIDSIEGALTLPAMTQACLDHLTAVSPERFFMMVEGGNIDHAGHGNDAATIVKEVLNFQEAIAIAYDFYKNHPDETLIVITADHETGGMALGNTTVGYNAHLQYFDYQKVSKGAFSDYCKGLLKSRMIVTWEDMKTYLEDNFGFWKVVPVSEAQDQSLREAFDKTFTTRNSATQETLYNSFDEFVLKVFDILDKNTGIGWTSTGHTGGLVPVYAIGNGAELFTPMTDNTAISRKILSAIRK